MGIIKTKGLILVENNMGDFDKMVTILTPSGKIGCAAKGARRPKSSLMAATQFLCFGDYMIYKGANSYHINSCEPIEIFYNIRIDLEKLQYASHIVQIIRDVTDENQNTYRILQLILNTIYLISETEKNKDFILAVFKMRLLCILGYTPKIKQCTICGETVENGYFSLKEDGFECEQCGKTDKSAIKMSPSTTNAIRYIISSPAKKLFSFTISEENQKQLELISRLYLDYKLEKEYRLETLW